MATLPQPPNKDSLAQGDGKPSPVWARWFQLLKELLVDLDSAQTLENKTLDTSCVITPTPWTALTLNSPWAAFGAPYRTLSYRKDIAGVVWLSGLIASSGDPGAFDTIATLPADYRPTAKIISPTMHASWGGTNRQVPIQIHTDGTVEMNFAAPGVAVTFLTVEFSFQTG